MNAIRMLKHVDLEIAEALPELRGMIGQDVEITVRPQGAAEDEPLETLDTFLGGSLRGTPPSPREMETLRAAARGNPALAAALEIAEDGGLDVDLILKTRNAGR